MTGPGDPAFDLALRPGPDPLETEMWAEALIGLLVDGELSVPLLIPHELLGEK